MCHLKATYVDVQGFRPRFTFYHWSASLLGMLGCVSLMILISWFVALIAITVVVALYAYVSRAGMQRDWGDAKQGFRFQVARDALLALAHDVPMHPKNWRPELLVRACLHAYV